jgi:serine/threonine protein kinase
LELYEAGDKKEEDCLGWITVMEKCESDLQTALKNENLNIDERKKIASGFQYLGKIGIEHNVIYGRKLSNFLLNGYEVKICDFGFVEVHSLRRSYRQLGYARRGSKYTNGFNLCKFLIFFFYFYLSFRNARIYSL